MRQKLIALSAIGVMCASLPVAIASAYDPLTAKPATARASQLIAAELPPLPAADPTSGRPDPGVANPVNQGGFVPSTLIESDNPTGNRQVVGEDDRVPVTSRAYPWSAIGRLEQMDTNGEVAASCTGTLIGKSLVLTNSHCVVDRQTGQLVKRVIRFRPNVIRDRSQAVAFAINIRYGETGENGFGPDDWALVTLDRDLGSQFGTIGWRSLPVEKLQALGKTIRLVGYSGDFPEQNPGRTASIHPGCSILQEVQGFLRHDCDTSSGASGGPLLAQFNGRYEIIALHAGTLGENNRAVLVSRWAAAASRALAASN